MTKTEIERRIVALEAEVARLKAFSGRTATAPLGSWHEIIGTFADDPAHEEAMRLGRKYRASLRPKARKQ